MSQVGAFFGGYAQISTKVRTVSRGAADLSTRINQQHESPMHALKKTIVTFAIAVGATVGCAAHAALFQYSYEMTDGSVASGQFSGTAIGDLVTGITGVSLTYKGTALFDDGFSASISNNIWTAGTGVASFSGFGNNFGFFDVNYPETPFNAVFAIAYEPSLPGPAGIGNLALVQAPSVENYDFSYAPGRWSLTAVGSNNVPEPGSLALIGLGLAGLAAARRRKQA